MEVLAYKRHQWSGALVELVVELGMVEGRSQAADEDDASDMAGQTETDSESVRGSGGGPGHSEPLQPELVSQFCHVGGEIRKSPPRLWVGKPVAGPLDRDQPHTGGRHSGRIHTEVTRAGHAMEVQHRRTVRRSVLAVAQNPAVSQPNRAFAHCGTPTPTFSAGGATVLQQRTNRH